MEYVQITSIDDPLFAKMHQLMQKVFPPEEVLEYELWREPVQDPQLRIFVAVENEEVIGATEYRYYADMNVAMTDFTIIGVENKGVGRFLSQKRQEDLFRMAQESGNKIQGMFAEIYNPYQVQDYSFGGIKPMDPFVRREVLSHLGYQKLDFDYLHPSWNNDGEDVTGLDLCFLAYDESLNELEGKFIAGFLKRYYAVLPNKPEDWYRMVDKLEQRQIVALLPI